MTGTAIASRRKDVQATGRTGGKAEGGTSTNTMTLGDLQICIGIKCRPDKVMTYDKRSFLWLKHVLSAKAKRSQTMSSKTDISMSVLDVARTR